MKNLVKKMLTIIFLMAVIEFALLFTCEKTAHAEEPAKLNVKIEPSTGATFIEKGEMYFTNGEVLIRPQDGLGDANTKRLILVSRYDGKEFSEYKECEDGVVKLFKDSNKAYEFVAVKIREVAAVSTYTNEGDEKALSGIENYIFESDIICIGFDAKAPEISGDSSVNISNPLMSGTKYKIKITDEGGIGRISLKNGENLIEEIDLCKPESAERITEYNYELILNASGMNNAVSVEVVDIAGNSNSLEFSYTIDNGSPDITISGIENGKTYDNSAEFTISVTDNMSELYSYYKCTYTGIDGLANVIEESLSKIEQSSFVISKKYDREGIYDIEFYAKDCLGNVTDTYYIYFAIDSNAPHVQIANIENGKLYKSGVDVYCVVSDMFFTGVNVNVSAEKITYGYDELSDGTKQKRVLKSEPVTLPSFVMGAKTSKIIYKFMEDGEYRITVSAKDSLGKESRTSAGFSIDSTIPEIAVTNDSGIVEGSALITNVPEFMVEVSTDSFGTDATIVLYRVSTGGIYEKIDEKIFIDTKNTIICPITVDKDGEYIINVTATDKAGNRSEKSLGFTIDMNPPIIGYLDAYNEKFLKMFTLPENLKDFISDTTAVKYRAYLNEEEIGYGDVKSDGRYLLQISAIDEAGNTSEKMAAFIIDSTAPKIVVNGLNESKNDSSVNKGDTINVSLLDKDDWFEKVTVNGIEVDVNRNKKELKLRVDNFGEYCVEILARDYAGNETAKVINTKCLAKGSSENSIEIKTLTKNTEKNREIFTREKPSLKFFVFCGFILATTVIFIVFALFDIKKIKC